VLAGPFAYLWTLTYHCDRDVRRIGEDESDLVELAATAPVLRQGDPVLVNRYPQGRNSVEDILPSGTAIKKKLLARFYIRG
jgi:hypothetical protein